MLIMAPSPTVAREHTAGLMFLLENLGFIINHPKLVLTPTQEILFLGFTISSTMMEISLPGDKIKQIRQDPRKLLDTQYPQAVALSRLLGKLNHAAHAIPPAIILQESPTLSLECTGQDPRGERLLSPSPNDTCSSSGTPMVARTPHHLEWTPPTDNSPRHGHRDRCLHHRLGWGALCHGMRIGGPWSQTESQIHINHLELLAASLAIK